MLGWLFTFNLIINWVFYFVKKKIISNDRLSNESILYNTSKNIKIDNNKILITTN